MECLNCGVLFEPSVKHKLRARGNLDLLKFCNQYCYRIYNKLPINNGRFSSTKMLGDKNVNWKGDKASYGAIHDYVNYHYGQPQICEQCPAKDLGSRKHQWANISGRYKRDRSDWIRLCAKCHFRYDDREDNFKEFRDLKIRKIMSNNKSGYKNVRVTKYGKYRTYITIDKKQVNLGSYKTPQEAYQVYKNKALELYGKY